jgi:hypothetical protein
MVVSAVISGTSFGSLAEDIRGKHHVSHHGDHVGIAKRRIRHASAAVRQQHAGALSGDGVVIDEIAGERLVAVLVDPLLLQFSPRGARLERDCKRNATEDR